MTQTMTCLGCTRVQAAYLPNGGILRLMLQGWHGDTNAGAALHDRDAHDC